MSPEPFIKRYDSVTQKVQSLKNSLEITEHVTDRPNHVDKCQYNNNCERPATVFVTTIFGKKHYCGYHFQMILYRADK